jgi:hypothetical protein
MRAIWKYPVKPVAEIEEIAFRVVPTGLDFDETGMRYLGTFQVNDGALVFHLYVDETKASPNAALLPEGDKP